MREFFNLLRTPQSLIYLIALIVYLVWVIRRIRRKRSHLDELRQATRALRQIDASQYSNMSKKAILESLPLKNKTIANRFQMIVNYALAGIPYTQDVLQSNEEEIFNLDDVVRELNIFPLLGLVGTTTGLIISLAQIGGNKPLELLDLTSKFIPYMTLAFSSTMYAVIFMIGVYFVFFVPLRRLQEGVIEELDEVSLKFHMELLRSKDINKISEKFYESIDRLEQSLRYVNEGAKYLNTMATQLTKYGEVFERGAQTFTENQSFIEQELQRAQKVLEEKLEFVRTISQEFSVQVKAILEAQTDNMRKLLEDSKDASAKHQEKSSQLFETIDQTIARSTDEQSKLLGTISQSQSALGEVMEKITDSAKASGSILSALQQKYEEYGHHKLEVVLSHLDNQVKLLQKLIVLIEKPQHQREGNDKLDFPKLQEKPIPLHQEQEEQGSWWKRLFNRE